MGFGTGHHATTRLCLSALQTLPLTDALVVDVGTGSGILAIAARLLGASRVLAIDTDPDAVHAARENLDLNTAAADVTLAVADLRTARIPAADVITANLTGALIVASAATLVGALRPGGRIVVSGLQTDERDAVTEALTACGTQPIWEQDEDGWVGLVVKKK
jgi:ribosomal protein L11 methyltransferase